MPSDGRFELRIVDIRQGSRPIHSLQRALDVTKSLTFP